MSALIDAQVGDPYYTNSLEAPAVYGSPATYNPDAGSFMDLLKFGIGHYASYQTAALNTPTKSNPAYVNASQAAPATTARNQKIIQWVLIVGAVFGAVLLLGKLKG